MERRSFLGLLAALPFVVKAAPVKEPELKPILSGPKVIGNEPWKMEYVAPIKWADREEVNALFGGVSPLEAGAFDDMQFTKAEQTRILARKIVKTNINHIKSRKRSGDS